MAGYMGFESREAYLSIYVEGCRIYNKIPVFELLIFVLKFHREDFCQFVTEFRLNLLTICIPNFTSKFAGVSCI